MLIEFSVSNYRSFRERQTLSMVAAPRLRKLDNVFKPELTGERFPDLLKACVVYGPNASGKSNLLRALDTVAQIARAKPSAGDVPLPVVPFRFDAKLADKPSVFELHFIHQGVRYQFELAATAERIVTERLTAFPKGKELLLYERRHSTEGDTYKFGRQMEGGADLLGAWQRLTAPKVLFIAQAVANSSEALTQLRAPFSWLKDAAFVLLQGMEAMANASQRLVRDQSGYAEDIASFLRDVDVPIARIRVEPVEKPKGLGNALEQLMGTGPRLGGAIPGSRTTLTHQTALGEADIRYEDESEGTKNLIGFWLPWSTREPWEKSAKSVLAVDELDSSLHPEIVTALVAKHLRSATHSQLIFTTHDTHLMDAKLLRRDQFWFTERDANGATQLRSLHDFEGRESEDIEKRYYEGRYRGLPILRRP